MSTCPLVDPESLELPQASLKCAQLPHTGKFREGYQSHFDSIRRTFFAMSNFSLRPSVLTNVEASLANPNGWTMKSLRRRRALLTRAPKLCGPERTLKGQVTSPLLRVFLF